MNKKVGERMGFLSKLFGTFRTPQQQQQQQQTENITISITSEYSSRYVKICQKTKGLLPCISINAIDGYVSPSGGFVNFARFQVIGINPKTKRKNKRVYETRSEEEACNIAENEGLIGPFEVTILPSVEPSEHQLSYAKDLEAIIPDGACSSDVSAIISRITDNDEQAASEKLAHLAHSYGLKFSRYHGRTVIMRLARTQLSSTEYNNFISECIKL